MSKELNKNKENFPKEEEMKKLEEKSKKLIEEDKSKEDMIKNNVTLKNHLRQVAKKIEEIISEYKERKMYGIPIDNNDNINKIDIKKFNEFVLQIEEQKNKTESYKEMIDYDNKYSQITKEENNLKYIKMELLKLKKEYEFLQKINKKQQNQIKILLNNNFNSHQIGELEENLKKLKNDYKLLNDNFKSSNLKLKEQNIEINALEKECSLIRENIELMKNTKIKPKDKDLIANNNNMNSEILILKNKIKEKKITKESQEESYINQLNIHLKKKKIIEDEIKDLENKLGHYYQQKKLDDLKIKEIKKMKNEVNKDKLKVNKDLNLQKQKQLKENMNNLVLLKYHSLKDNSEIRFNFSYKNYLLEDEKRKTKISNRSFKKPNLKIAKFNVNSKSSINIFNNNSNKMTKGEEKKKKKEEEKKIFIKNIENELEKHEKQRGEMIQEIEYLKDDIEQILNKNESIDKNIGDIKKEKNEKINRNIINDNENKDDKNNSEKIEENIVFNNNKNEYIEEIIDSNDK